MTNVNPHFYRLETYVCILNDTRVLRFPGAFYEASNQLFERHIIYLDVREEETHRFVCISAMINQHIILPSG